MCQCCSQGPLSELLTLTAPPAHQPPPRPVTLTSRSVQLDWDEPLAPNGIIERWGETHEDETLASLRKLFSLRLSEQIRVQSFHFYFCSVSSCELHLRSPCPQPPQPVPLPCVEGPVEICFFGNRRSYNVTGDCKGQIFLVFTMTHRHPGTLNKNITCELCRSQTVLHLWAESSLLQ